MRRATPRGYGINGTRYVDEIDIRHKEDPAPPREHAEFFNEYLTHDVAAPCGGGLGSAEGDG